MRKILFIIVFLLPGHGYGIDQKEIDAILSNVQKLTTMMID